MLMITRRAGERVIVGGDIIITLVEVSGQTARIGIEAPKSMPIFREEIWIEVMRENEAAAQAAGATLPEVVAPLQPPGGSSAAPERAAAPGAGSTTGAAEAGAASPPAPEPGADRA